MKKLKDSQTYLNLARAFAGECQARTRYEFVEYGFRYNGYEAIATLIDKIVYQEFNHARMLYTFIQKADDKQIDNIEICAGFPFREKWDLEENLKLLAEDENTEANIYADFISTAKKEGFPEIATLFEQIMAVEIKHRDIFKEIHKQFKLKKFIQNRLAQLGLALLVVMLELVNKLGTNVRFVKLNKAFVKLNFQNIYKFN